MRCEPTAAPPFFRHDGPYKVTPLSNGHVKVFWADYRINHELYIFDKKSNIYPKAGRIKGLI